MELLTAAVVGFTLGGFAPQNEIESDAANVFSLYTTEGDLSLSRQGGAPPHQAKFTVFWNWKQSLFIPSNSGVHGPDGRYLASAGLDRTVKIWDADPPTDSPARTALCSG